jgi:hypothetical protein
MYHPYIITMRITKIVVAKTKIDDVCMAIILLKVIKKPSPVQTTSTSTIPAALKLPCWPPHWG